MKGNWRSCRCLQVVNIHKFQVYKAISRLKVNKSSKQDFIKVILTKDQERSEGDKKQMWIRKSRYVESDGTHCCIGKFNTALSLCRILGITLYLSKGFSEVAARGLAVVEILQPLGMTMVYFLEQEFNLWSPAPQ